MAKQFFKKINKRKILNIFQNLSVWILKQPTKGFLCNYFKSLIILNNLKNLFFKTQYYNH
ncbi:MAG: hypothetical protein B6D44_01875 [Ignavibacteriales bacterium UTCHB2]|nr:MAG: hypothetical protein B6D44_01875 [Ignavibacteriales bacterium UTCHB2]